jgi:hypothetical protein
MANTELHDLVASLGAVYWQDPMVTDGYVLSGSAVTHIVNLVDSVQVAKIGSDTIVLDTMCSQPCFTYNPQPASGSGNPAIRRSAYGAVTSCLETDFTLFFVTDDAVSVLFSYGDPPPSASPFLHVITVVSGLTFGIQVEKDKNQVLPSEVVTVASGISQTHHVFEVVCSNTDCEILVDGVSLVTDTWGNSAEAWEDPLTVFQSGASARGPDSSSADHRVGQMALFPSILSSSDRALVRAAMTLAMCSGHPTGEDPIWASTLF